MLKKFPKYVWICFIAVVIIQSATYYLTQLLNQNRTFYDLTIHCIDDKVPFIPFFVVFYILAYPSWFISPFVMAKLPKKDYFNWLISGLILYIVFFAIYIIIPTTISRPTVENDDIFNWLVNIIYINDTPSRPTNLFPSLHCELSIMCYIGVAGKKVFPKWYRITLFVLMILVCLSTQFIKQHYIVDLFASLSLTLIVYLLVHKFDLAKYVLKGERV